jgi:hypothetical protein
MSFFQILVCSIRGMFAGFVYGAVLPKTPFIIAEQLRLVLQQSCRAFCSVFTLGIVIDLRPTEAGKTALCSAMFLIGHGWIAFW